MAKTVVGLFSSMSEAEQVKQILGANTQSLKATVIANSVNEDDEEYGVNHHIGSHFNNLTGGDDNLHQYYASGINNGGGLLVVTCADSEAEEVALLLKQNGAKDIDASYGEEAEAGVPVYGQTGAAQTTGETAIPVVEEELVVGKREVNRGGVRVYSHVTEVPVSTDVSLHEERITLERRPVSRVATAADFTAGSAGTIELKAMGEEAVVGKSARVVEEILVGKEATQRTDTITDTVRRTEVEVEDIPATTTTNGTELKPGVTTSTGFTTGTGKGGTY